MCEWCGTNHAATALCPSKRPSLTRRKFFFLFGAGVAGAMLAPAGLLTGKAQDLRTAEIILEPAWEWVEIGELKEITFLPDTWQFDAVMARTDMTFPINFVGDVSTGQRIGGQLSEMRDSNGALYFEARQIHGPAKLYAHVKKS